MGKYRNESHRCNKWDYASEGIYFVTICTKNRSDDFGHVENGQMILNENGLIVDHCWSRIPLIYTHVSLDAYVIMPDHIHGILHIDSQNVCRDVSVKRPYNKYHKRYSYQGYNPWMSEISAHPGSLSVIIRMFKGACTKHIRNTNPDFRWQSNFHDRIIRSDYEYHQFQKYIQLNPQKWNPDSHDNFWKLLL